MSEKNIEQLISIATNGLRIPTFSELKTALIARYKSIYGSDIDVSNTSADGIFIQNVALIINNILQGYATLYSNLNPNTASGKYLDIIASYSNITRRSATKSRAVVAIKNRTSQSVIINPAKIVNGRATSIIDPSRQMALLDRGNGVWWVVSGPNITLPPAATQGQNYLGEMVEVEADEYGPIYAPAGYINSTLEVNANYEITQVDPATPGTNRESDQSLRARRAGTLSANSTTVEEGLISSLSSISGVSDVLLLPNTASVDVHAADGDCVKIPPHSVYVIVREGRYRNVDKSLLGKTIRAKMTPGIQTVCSTNVHEPSDLTGLSEETSYTLFEADPSYATDAIYKQKEPFANGKFWCYQISVGSMGYKQLVYWKQTLGRSPLITAFLSIGDHFQMGEASSNYLDTGTTWDSIYSSLISDYANNLAISDDILQFDVAARIKNGDKKYRGEDTFTLVGNPYIDLKDDDWANPDTHVEYEAYLVRTCTLKEGKNGSSMEDFALQNTEGNTATNIYGRVDFYNPYGSYLSPVEDGVESNSVKVYGSIRNDVNGANAGASTYRLHTQWEDCLGYSISLTSISFIHGSSTDDMGDYASNTIAISVTGSGGVKSVLGGRLNVNVIQTEGGKNPQIELSTPEDATPLNSGDNILMVVEGDIKAYEGHIQNGVSTWTKEYVIEHLFNAFKVVTADEE